ncbi:hypothetical protein NEF87_000853 [Candidatus Lokiarchaeum ossiferum]|uniref:ABC3 transporter permease C-terminal domain-containing protein n=1 Tax=Candidatus Lokiarchaeum ossiferum TaxID=2951803 RepID=A0ABY6HMN6_9ARCH|nr:hypothetical protein NEF87_000853 [Candidatus Lokiarchaeum sp. B-35]
MGNRFTYYLSQGTRNVKSSILIIIAFSITLSLISGLGYYSDSYQRYKFDIELNNVIDYEVVLNSNTFELPLVYNIPGTLQRIHDLYEESEYSPDHIPYFSYFTTQGVDLFDNISQNTLPFSMGAFDSEFYHYDRFSEFFTILEGRSPENPGEILIDSAYAQYLNMNLSKTTNVYIRVDREKAIGVHAYDNLENHSIPNEQPDFIEDQIFGYNLNATVVGIFKPNRENYRFSVFEFSSNLLPTYINETTGVFSSAEIHSAPILTYYNYIKDSKSFYFRNLFYNIENEWDSNDLVKLIESRICVGGIISRGSFKLSNMNSLANKMRTEDIIIRNQLDQISNDYRFIDYTQSALRILYGKTDYVRTTLLLMNIPILLTAILLGSFARKTEVKSRLEEFLLLKSKGVPPMMIGNQFIVESLFIAFFSTALGLICGTGGFFLFRSLFIEIFDMKSASLVALRISMNSILDTFLFGILLSFLGSAIAIRFVIKMPVSELLSSIGSQEMDAIYDERSLFGKKSWEISTDEDPSKISDRKKKDKPKKPKKKWNLWNSTNLFNSQRDLQRQLVRETKSYPSPGLNAPSGEPDSGTSFYVDPLKEKEAKIINFSYAFILLSTIPLILFALIYLGSLPSASDQLAILSADLKKNLTVLTIFIIISPIFFALGVIRLFTKEKPSFFANLSKKISEWFLKERGFLVGIEMVRRKQYKTVILIIGIFTALFCFTNVYLNTNARYENIYANLEIGADVRTELSGVNLYMENLSDIVEFEDAFLNYNYSDGNPMVNNMVTCYNPDSTSRNYTPYLFDYENYMKIIDEDKKMLPSGQFRRDMQALIKYNKNPENNTPGVLVNQDFLTYNLKNEGDLFNFTFSFINSSTEEVRSTTILVKLLKTIEILPGIFHKFGVNQFARPMLACDIQFANSSPEIMYGDAIYQLFDITSELTSNSSLIEDHIANITQGFIRRFNHMEFYDQNWNSVSLKATIGTVGVYGVLYFDFIIVGILIAIGLAVLILALEKENKFFNGVLLSRGFGKKGLLQLILSELIVIFTIGILIGLFCGFSFSAIFVKVGNYLEVANQSTNFPIYANLGELFGILGLIMILSLIISYVAFLIESRQNISKFFHKF